ncbi:MAG TPA: hypothetical protein VFI15_00935 [Candidatus Limnocylindrales bacterium]|nr:hypothetical protein [Candidatus Limnocylindrales bacterium]
MTAFVLPNLDQSTIDELRKRIPDMSEFDIPKLENLGKDVGKTADQALDRLLGRSRAPVWPWVAGSLALAAIVGVVAAWFTWFRRPTDTLIDEESTWEAPTSSTPGSTSSVDTGVDYASDLGGVTTDRTIDSETIGAIGTFGDRTAEEYPAAER